MLRAAASRVHQRAAAVSRRSFASATSVEGLALRSMVGAFRKHGHLEASLDPLHLEKPKPLPELASAAFAPVLNLGAVDASSEVFFSDAANTTPEALYAQLRSTYCGPIGIEMEHLRSTEEREWLAKAMESPSLKVTPAMQRNAFTAMMTAEVFENFLAKKFSSFKRYSGEGAESMLAAIQTILSTASAEEVSDVIIGMPHRGRLALLVGLLEYPVHKLLYKIQGHSEFPDHIHGVDDVTSHIAQSMDYGIGNKVHVSLLHNPSHLEIINPVATGKARAKNDAGAKAMALLLHGDAAFSGQGCVPEGLSLSQLPSFKTDGSVHIVVNNQVGFTTTKRDGRSSTYCTDVAKGFEIPVIHVNGESVSDVLQAAHIATQFRNKFKKDIVIDLWTFRRHGHNEVDEPRFTQPGMYGAITAKGSFPTVYGQQLVEQKVLTPEAIEKLKTKLTAHLEAELAKTASYKPTDVDAFKGKWATMHQPTPAEQRASVDTGVAVDTLKQLALASVDVPASIKVHDRLERTHIQARKKLLAQENVKVDWSTAEAMAFGSLLKDGHSVRLAGQDCRRATFSHRHAAFTDQGSEDMYFPFQHLPEALNPTKSRFSVVNSNLSELAVLGYEYGYSWEDPKNLCIWEAQFGDFFNGAQIVIDQFIASGESKWMRQSGLVMLLPHGYDGAGPDHSSGKPERFLQLVDTQALESTLRDSLSAYETDINMSVVNLTTPANYFHLLRRQQLRDFRKPVVVMAPKTLLRLAEATSSLDEMAPGTSFQPVIGDDLPKADVKRVLFVSGKLYYDLVKQRAAHGRHDTAIIRVEELAPFPFAQVQEQLASYENVTDVTWIQEEPVNQGAWLYVRPHFEKVGVKDLKFIGRDALPTSAVGLSKRNAKEAAEIMREAWSA
ncbi:oxoglutarate dehydrogenase (succinyl-transferring), E1 component [Saprolegnia diclina VS20]|uniref:Oxoglutarate dehydrogenase (Succinyl-transferring), E1 component n=1 Tax=Saprolegnia diclina (strain VS20) TaxID=1156394 RepID=T0R8A3_SAPDV|nr:oxoglutarate dehydrogenase (succinyl-transferring), E1 component [Saprolegnia diclina VS20]EQC25722.1 oxoglutarate dehydrogenase (succinyl-transferring), E1 component [Saprolegnia diclina VS20]|eukprot:XP_008620855.1 oxoglutarate dehydrogenase (succinyl-transferring), E1 component [Saprolegnia diclina VS20]